MAQRRCTKCGRLLADTDFYTSNNIERFPPDGKMAECKKCWTMHVDNWNPDTYLWILEDCDVPWVPKEWNDLMAKYANFSFFLLSYDVLKQKNKQTSKKRTK